MQRVWLFYKISKKKHWENPFPRVFQLYGNLPPITKTIQVRRTRHAGHCWRSRDELISDVLLWTPTHGRAKAGRPARTYIQQLCEDTGCSPEDLPEAMNDRKKWRERVRDICATSTTWWWWMIGTNRTPSAKILTRLLLQFPIYLLSIKLWVEMAVRLCVSVYASVCFVHACECVCFLFMFVCFTRQ